MKNISLDRVSEYLESLISFTLRKDNVLMATLLQLRPPLFMFLCALASLSMCVAQKNTQYPEDQLREREAAAHLRFLASDELMGRMTGSPSIDVAARYIAEQFREWHLEVFPGMGGYFQPVPLQRRVPSTNGQMILLGDTLVQGKKMAMRAGAPVEWKGEYVYAGFGAIDPEKKTDDYKGLDVKGKTVIVRFGAEGNVNPRAGMELSTMKQKLAADRGAVAIIELYKGTFAWRLLASFLSRPGMELGAAGPDLPHFMVEDTSFVLGAKLQKQIHGPMSIQSGGIRREPIPARNVIGYIRGSDPKLRDEYVLLTAHYDHLGTGKGRSATADTIFNGARDNAMGVVALIEAAQAFSVQPPKRSVIIAAVTGEEVGEFGSRHLSANPPVPMDHIVFDLNSDGAGFDDTTIVTVVGLERTTAEGPIQQGSQRYGLTAIADPVPEQHLFDRSDNTNFAALGVPAPTYSAGFRSFGDEIMKYYHKAEDQVDDSFNFSYFLKFCKAYVHSARLIADMKEKPFWKPGDKYESAGKMLYRMQ